MSLLAWTWWQTGPTHWNPGTPERDRVTHRSAGQRAQCPNISSNKVKASQIKDRSQGDGKRDDLITSPKQLQALVKCVTAAIRLANYFSEHIHYSVPQIHIPTLIGDIIAARVPKHEHNYTFSKESYSHNLLMNEQCRSSLSQLIMTSGLYWKCIMGLAVQSNPWRPKAAN